MPAPEDSHELSDNGSKEHLQTSEATPISSLVEDENSSSYGAFVPVVDRFLPLGGGSGDDVEWSDGRVVFSDDIEEDYDANRPSAATLIYLCALCSSLTSVLLGYGKRKGKRGCRHESIASPLRTPLNCKAVAVMRCRRITKQASVMRFRRITKRLPSCSSSVVVAVVAQ